MHHVPAACRSERLLAAVVVESDCACRGVKPRICGGRLSNARRKPELSGILHTGDAVYRSGALPYPGRGDADIMIKIENLTKSYRTPQGRHYVFKNLNLELPSGKSVALIGRNGAGKSTLLRMIGGIDRPDSGRIVTDKTISWPVGLSGGFQGSLTGRENVKFVARLYAKKEELKEKIEFVEDFAELGKYFDMPIKTYSSGMKSRLGFGLSMAFKFDYYLVDEVTAVGDARFKQKCAKLFNSKRDSSSFLMVSHNLTSLLEFCDVAIYLDKDRKITLYNDVNECVKKYKEDDNLN